MNKTEELLTKYGVNLNELTEKYDLVVFRCVWCADDIKNHNPYVYPDGTPIPISKIKVIITNGIDDCENSEHIIKPIPLYSRENKFEREYIS